jgi:hypothetical protein
MKHLISLEKIEELVKAKTQTPWTGHANYPFYAVLDKPSASLSKNDGTRPEYWTISDVEFVLAMANGGAEYLLNEVKWLQAYIAERALKDEQS